MGARALTGLHEISVGTYFSRASEIVVRRGMRVVRNAPLLVRMVFIGVRDAAHLQTVNGQPGIAEVVANPEPDETAEGNIEGYVTKPARLDPVMLQQFVDALARGEIVAPVGLSVGHPVLVREGPFSSFPATIEELLPTGRIRVAVSISGMPSPVKLDIAHLQADLVIGLNCRRLPPLRRDVVSLDGDGIAVFATLEA